MQKTTVYLPDDLKKRLGEAAAHSGVSEAELIRKGVEEVVEWNLAPMPTIPLFSSGELAELTRDDDTMMAAVHAAMEERLRRDLGEE